MEWAAVFTALDSFSSVIILLAVLWLLAKGKLRLEADVKILVTTLEKRIEELAADRDFYREKYADGEEVKKDRDWYRDRLQKSTDILGNLLSTVEVEEKS